MDDGGRRKPGFDPCFSLRENWLLFPPRTWATALLKAAKVTKLPSECQGRSRSSSFLRLLFFPLSVLFKQNNLWPSSVLFRFGGKAFKPSELLLEGLTSCCNEGSFSSSRTKKRAGTAPYFLVLLKDVGGVRRVGIIARQNHAFLVSLAFFSGLGAEKNLFRSK